MAQIYKYKIDPGYDETIDMPAGANILHVAEQNGELYLWATVEDEADMAERIIAIRATGDTVTECTGDHLGTVVMTSGLVWHVFDKGEL